MLEEGLPQGSALSCTLFLIYMNDLSSAVNVEKALFADDLVLWHTSKFIKHSKRRLDENLKALSVYCNLWKMKINTNKSVYSIFTKSNKINKTQLKLNIGEQLLKKENNPTYLGVKLDRQLNLSCHVETVKKKCMDKLKLVKRLASTSWGSDRNTLRTLYLGYVRSVLDYSIALQCLCSPTARKSLDQVQNEALRFINGGMRSTPISACEIHANVEPLELRRKKAATEMFERYKRLDPSHPNRKMVVSWKPKNRIKQRSILHHATVTASDYHLPERKEAIKNFHKDLPPYRNLKSPKLRPLLKRQDINKNSDPHILKDAAEETIHTYPKEWIHVYTDGSAYKSTVSAGYGVLIKLPDDHKIKLYNSCGATCSNYEAELIGITAAIEQLEAYFLENPESTTNVVIFTDSQSVLMAMDAGPTKSNEIKHLLLEINSLMNTMKIQVYLQWIPGHSEILGNEEADKLAKKGSSLPQVNVPTSYETARIIIKQNAKEEWLNKWAKGKTGRMLYKHMAQPRKKDDSSKLSRKEQITIFRLRTGHFPLNYHFNRLCPEHPPMCQLCPCPYETVNHILFECPALQDNRSLLLPTAPDIDNTLYGTTQQLGKTCTYIYMALGRRAATQVPLER